MYFYWKFTIHQESESVEDNETHKVVAESNMEIIIWYRIVSVGLHSLGFMAQVGK